MIKALFAAISCGSRRGKLLLLSIVRLVVNVPHRVGSVLLTQELDVSCVQVLSY